MKLIYEPKVYIVGTLRVDQHELGNFLRGHGVENWDTDAVHDPELLCEVAGRLCYMSFGKPRPGGNQAYLERILSSKHGSVTEHAVWNFIVTGVSRTLTHELVRHRAGWGYCLSGETLIYSEKKSNGVRQGPKKRKIKDIYHMTKTPHGRSRLKLIKLRCFDGDEFTTTRIKSVVYSGTKPVVKITLADGKQIRCSADHRFLTPDGWEPVKNLTLGQPLATNGLPAIGLSKKWLRERYHDKNMMIEDIAKEAGCSPATVRKWIARHGLQKQTGKGMVGRNPWNKGKTYQLGWHHSEETKQLLSEQKTGELNHSWKGDNASQQAGRLRAQQAFPAQPCESCGAAEGHRHHKDRNALNNDPSNISFLCGSCHTKLHLSEDGHPSCLTVKWVAIKSIEPDGVEKTYDIEVEHPCHNFVANGFVTHNSQLSQRYVDESVAEFVVPHDLRNEVAAAEQWLNECKRSSDWVTDAQDAIQEITECKVKHPGYATHTGLEWIRSVQRDSASYKQTVKYLYEKISREKYESFVAVESKKETDIGEKVLIPSMEQWTAELTQDDKTEIRKGARQAARSVLPNCTETKIFCTANARAIRHFLEMRASRHAEPEIRKMAYQLWQKIAPQAMNLFGDYSATKLRDDTYELTTPHVKV